jgi:hypothetical protein
MSKKLEDELAYVCWEIENDLKNAAFVKEKCAILAELRKERNAEIYWEEVRKRCACELELREKGRKEDEDEERRLLFVIMYFVLNMKDKAHGYLHEPNEFFYGMRSGYEAKTYNGF